MATFLGEHFAAVDNFLKQFWNVSNFNLGFDLSAVPQTICALIEIYNSTIWNVYFFFHMISFKIEKIITN